jgi:pre-mRNA-splicing factor SYF2
MDQRLQKFRELHMRRNEARNKNLEEVKEEDRKNRETPKDIAAEQKRRREAEKLLVTEEARQRGDDYQRLQNLNYSLEECEQWEEQKEKKVQKRDQGFADYRQATIRKYERLTDSLKVDESQRRKTPLPIKELDIHSLAFPRDDEARVHALVTDLNMQEHKRKAYSRRRVFDTDDVDYINERNRRFNQKIARAFDAYTSDIKDNLERGTAL